MHIYTFVILLTTVIRYDDIVKLSKYKNITPNISSINRMKIDNDVAFPDALPQAPRPASIPFNRLYQAWDRSHRTQQPCIKNMSINNVNIGKTAIIDHKIVDL